MPRRKTFSREESDEKLAYALAHGEGRTSRVAGTRAKCSDTGSRRPTTSPIEWPMRGFADESTPIGR